MRLEAMKKQAGRPSKENASPLATNYSMGRSDVELSEQVGESKDQIRRYAAQLGEYRPYIVLSPAFGEIRAEFVRNEKKHAMRQQRSENLFGYDEKTELLNPECQVQDYLTDIIAKSDEEHEKSLLLDAMSTLTETEKSRIVQHYCFGLSEREIAEQEGKSKNAVHLSLCSGIKKLKEFFKTT